MNLQLKTSGKEYSSSAIRIIRDTWDRHNSGAVPWSKFVSQGAIILPLRKVTAAYTLSDLDYVVIASSASSLTITLPDATPIMGRIYVVISGGSGMVTITPSLSQTINGGSSLTLASIYNHAQLFSDGAAWWAI
jgi:hypothetical protein